ncbi:MAG: (2Fe-2S)-binding protein [Bryobacteraceae bacterium]
MTRFTIDGRAATVKPGTTVAVAILASGQVAPRRSVSGTPRGPLCGMGICFECRVTIDGKLHQRSCQIVCWEGMVIRTA